MKTADELRGSKIVVKVAPLRYRYPKKKADIIPGCYSVVAFEVRRILKGELPENFENKEIIGAGYNIPSLRTDASYVLTGELVKDAKWGYQYKIEEIHMDYDLSRPADQRKFFSFFLTESRIDQLFEVLDDPIKCLRDKNIKELQKVKGIGPVMAVKIIEKYEECKDNSRAYVELKDLGLTKTAIDRLVKHYHSADVAIEKIKTNPYILIKEVRGYGWEKADAIAIKNGFSNGSKERAMAYAQYYLEKQADDCGNSWVSIDIFLSNIVAVCAPATKEQIAAWLKEDMAGQTDLDILFEKPADINLNGDLPTFFYEKEQRRVGLYSYRILEKLISHHFDRLVHSRKKLDYDKKVCEQIIAETEKEVGYEYTDEQKTAMWNILDNNVNLLVGSGGTGKTHTLKPLIKIFKHYELNVEQTALSGRASSLLGEITEVSGKTIHRLLGYMPETETFAHTSRYPLRADVIILDETSMVGIELFLSLISAIKRGAKLIMLGDIKQLPPISVGNILSDCISSSFITCNILTKVHRQAAKSGIIAQSLLVADGKSLVKGNFLGEEYRGELKDFKLISSTSRDLIYYNIIKEFKNLIYNKQVAPQDILIVVPNRLRGNTSCRALNDAIQSIVNPATDIKKVDVKYKENGTEYHITYKVGDRVLVTKNNYHAINLTGDEQPIFNGNIGTVRDIGDGIMVVHFEEQGDVVIGRQDWNNLNLAYAITVHKAQGGQAPYVIIGMDYSAYALLSRELLYTAITRAQKFCILVGEPRALNMAVKTSSIKLKQTWLKDDLLKLKIKDLEEEI